MSARFPLAPAQRRFVARRAISWALVGALLFFGTMLASRVRQSSALLVLGIAGALVLVYALRTLMLGTRALSVGESAVWIAGRGYALASIDSLELRDGALVVRTRGRAVEARLAEPAMAAAEIARRAGLRPPRKGESARWERREATP